MFLFGIAEEYNMFQMFLLLGKALADSLVRTAHTTRCSGNHKTIFNFLLKEFFIMSCEVLNLREE